MKKIKISLCFVSIIALLVGVITVNVNTMSAAGISDPSVLSLTQDTDSFIVDPTYTGNGTGDGNVVYAPHTIYVNANNVKTGDSITIDLGNLTMYQNPIVSAATVKVSGSTLTFTFTQDINGSISIPFEVKASYNNYQKKLSDIEAAIASGKVPGPQTITATETRKEDGTVYESNIVVNAELLPYSTPINVRFANLNGASFAKNTPISFGLSSYQDFLDDGLYHRTVGYYNPTVVHATIVLPAGSGFVMDTVQSIGWSQSGDVLTYDGSTNGSVYGMFTGETGTYTAPLNTSSMTAYFGYDPTPSTFYNTTQPIKLNIVAPGKPPTVYTGSPATYEQLYLIDPALVHGRVPADIPNSSTTIYFDTNTPGVTMPGDVTVANAHWEWKPSGGGLWNGTTGRNPDIVDSFTVPTEAIAGAEVTFQDGTTKTYPSGSVVTFDNPDSNSVTKIVMDFKDLPNSSQVAVPVKTHLLYAENSVNGELASVTVTGSYSDGSTFGPLRNPAYVLGGKAYKKLHSNLGFVGDTTAAAVSIQYGNQAGKLNALSKGGSKDIWPPEPNTFESQYGVEQIYEPIIYYVLPLGVNYQGLTGGVAGYKATTYTISTGQTVVKIDYTGSDKIVGSSPGYPAAGSEKGFPVVDFVTKAYGIPQTSNVYYYVSAENDPVMVTTPSGAGAIPDATLASEITQGNDKATYAGSKTYSINGASYLIGDTTITNNQGITGKEATNDLMNGVDHALHIDLVNTTKSDGGKFSTLTNLPDASNGLTLNLTGPAVLVDVVSGLAVEDAAVGEVLYSTATQAVGTEIDESGYVSADEVSDWSKIKSFIVKVSKLDVDSEYMATLPITAPDAIHQLNKDVEITTEMIGNGLHTQLLTTDKFISTIPILHGSVHYDANTGTISSLPADQTTVDFLDIDTNNHPVTLSNTKPTKNADAYYIYTFKEWNTKADGSGTPYNPGDTIENIAGGDTINLYAQWTETAIPAVSATLHYDGNTGDATSIPGDDIVAFQPNTTGTITISSTIPTKAADAYYMYTFKEWNTKVDGTGTPYAAEDTINGLAGGSTTTLYAQWNETAIPAVSATLHYDANTGDTNSLPVDATATFQPSQTGTITISSTVPTKEADAYYTYSFKEWNTQADGLGTAYLAGDEIDNLAGESTTTLYAQWNQTLKSSTVTVHYVDTEGNTIADDVVMSDVIGSEYTTKSLGDDMLVNGEITYTLVSTPVNATGTYTPEGIEVTYVYSLSKSMVPDPIASSSVTVRHVDQNGISIAEDVVMVGEVGHTYTTSALNGEALIIGDTTYELSEVPDNANGVYGMSNTVVTYVYTIVDDEVEAPIKKPSIAPSTPTVPVKEISKAYPDTGDTTNVAMLIALMVVSGLVIGLSKKKKIV